MQSVWWKTIFTVRNEVAKVMFLQASVCPRGGGVSQHALQEVSQHGLQQISGGGVSQHALQEVSQHALQQVSGGYPSMHCRRYPSMPLSRPTPKGEIEGDQVQAHIQGGNWGGSGPGPHPRGKLRGIRSRPTPKGKWREIRSRPTPKG